MFNTNEPFSLNLNPDTLPDVSLEHDSTTNEVHLKFFNVDDEVVLDLWGQLNDVGSLISGLSTIAKSRRVRARRRIPGGSRGLCCRSPTSQFSRTRM